MYRRLIPSVAAGRSVVVLPTAVSKVSAMKAKAPADTGVAAPAGDSHHKRIKLSNIHYDTSKAGLEKVDKEYVKRVIAEATKNSPFNRNEEKRQKERERNNLVMVKKAKHFRTKLSQKERLEYKQKADEIIDRLESERDLKSKVFIHIDMDMFYAAVEERRNPALKTVPFAVGSNAMLSTSNYIARQYGVRSGMPGFIARKLCPQITIVPSDMDRYRQVAEVVRDVVRRYDPLFVTIGLDEVTMDVTKYIEKRNKALRKRNVKRSLLYTPVMVCEHIRADIQHHTQLTCSAGIGPTPAFAKLASNYKKPDGQHLLKFKNKEEVLHFMKDIPIRQVSGIGFAQEGKLKHLGITHCKHFLQHKALLAYLFKDKTLEFYLSAGLGLMKTHVDRSLAALSEKKKQNTAAGLFVKGHAPHSSKQSGKPYTPVLNAFSIGGGQPRKSIGKEKTLSKKLVRDAEILQILHDLLRECHETLLREGLTARGVGLVVKDHQYQCKGFVSTLPKETNDFKHLLAGVKALLERHQKEIPTAEWVRLLGVRLTRLTPVHAAAQQPVKANKKTPTKRN
ncbi:DNA polymerase kappa subunit [Angomonas deanei]|uniref:DNA polymerase kappa n=1 Tax=Angomonas deanei TaxID=59799 RepID=A0A7G2CGD3_9TRYP|nr:DNA polymerase kappa subunit [Angomonas deanei]CAD2218890.1 impB/mucB/samB family/impB/mucB/samB family C-terminal domain containing protein, putative [Angomonas deanei]|eukprot:EPY32099.1 DNA polymerase kappa subunit [Angomonas deanei]